MSKYRHFEIKKKTIRIEEKHEIKWIISFFLESKTLIIKNP
mgnify:CR=1 FL=1